MKVTDESGFLNVFVWNSFKGNSNCSKPFLICYQELEGIQAHWHILFIIIREPLEINNYLHQF